MRTEDGYLIRKCLDGESAAFGLLIDKYKAGIYALAYYNLQNFHDAEDIAQETFIKAYENLHKLKNYDSFLAWLYSITSNLCKNFIRNKNKGPDDEFIADQTPAGMEASSINHYKELLNNEKLDEIDEAIHKAISFLPAAYQQVLTLYYLGGMNCIQIAKFVGKSPTAIRKQLDRARDALKNEIISLISSSFEQQKAQRLQATFTFRIVEAVKRIKIHPTIQTKNLPWGISLATGIIMTAILCLIPHHNLFSPIDNLAGYPLHSNTKVLKVGEIPVDLFDESRITILSNQKKDGDKTETKLNDRQKDQSQGGKGQWIRKADMPTSRAYLSTSVVNDKIYAIGGRLDTDLVVSKTPNLSAIDPSTIPNLSTVEEYCPATGIWTKKANMPTSRRGISTCTLNGKVYTIGGFMGVTNFTGVVEQYDPATDTWAKITEMPLGPRAGVGSVAVNGKILVIGGWKGQALSRVEEYDPVTDKWVIKADMSIARGDLAVAVVNGKVYAAGGRGGKWPKSISKSDLEEYDPLTDTWTKKANMPTARQNPFASVLNDRIYVIGGVDKSGVTVGTVEVYNPITDTWTKESDMPTRRWGLSTSMINGKIYAIGGLDISTGKTSSIVEEYTPGNLLPATEDGKVEIYK